MTLKKADFSKICRMCLLIKNEMLTIQTSEVIEMITNCIGIEVKLNDGLPQTICGECSEQIYKYSSFRQKCKNSDRILHEIITTDSESDENDRVISPSIKKEPSSSDIKEEPFHSENIVLHKEKEVIRTAVFIKKELEVSETGENEVTVKHEIDSTDESTDNCFVHTTEKISESHINSKKANSNKHISNKTRLKKKLKKQKCDECSKTFRKPCELSKHLTDVHKRKKTLECQVCSKTFHLQIQLDLHLKLHFKTRHICTICNKEFGDSSNLKRHQKIHNKREQIFCLYCDRSFITDGSYKRHVRVFHTESGAIVKKTCPLCGKAVVDVDLHIKFTHNKTRDFKCDQCDKSFVGNSLLAKHIEEKHLGIEKQLKALCFICGKTCLNQGVLKRHLQMHDDNREFKCKLCNKKYKSRHGLQRHLKVHKGIRPYECTFCSKKYLEKKYLEEHLYVHRGERPYACHICGRTFSYKAARWTHMKVHNITTESTKNTNSTDI